MIDWHERSEVALGALQGHAGSSCYQCLVDWLQSLYEKEKEGIALCEDPERLMWYWLRLKGLKDLKGMLEEVP